MVAAAIRAVSESANSMNPYPLDPPVFFDLLTDTDVEWRAAGDDTFVGVVAGEVRHTASRADLIFGSHSELRAIAEVYAADDGEDKFVCDFADAWAKVMNADREFS